MIYNPIQQRICIGVIDTKDLFKTLPCPSILNVKGWWERQQHRQDIRLYAFIKDVLKNGFVDPIIVWYNDDKKEFSLHPGMNRVMLNRVLDIPMAAWVISYDIKDYKRLGKVFPGITKLKLDPSGNRDISMTAQHRKDNRLYEIVFDNDKILPTMRTAENDAQWNEVQKRAGFYVWCGGEQICKIGSPTKDDHWNVKDVSGIYELALKYFFNYEVKNAFIHRRTT